MNKLWTPEQNQIKNSNIINEADASIEHDIFDSK